MRSWKLLGNLPLLPLLVFRTALHVDLQQFNMPGDGYFGFSVLIAGLPVAEYRQNGKVYVESNLWTPVSYKQSFREMAYGEVRQSSPAFSEIGRSAFHIGLAGSTLGGSIYLPIAN